MEEASGNIEKGKRNQPARKFGWEGQGPKKEKKRKGKVKMKRIQNE